jgi:4'-phosphopantetheinyl transferase
MPPDLALAHNHVHIFLIPTDLPGQTLSHLETLLTPEEQTNIARLRIPAKRTEALISRASLRQTLAHFLHTAPQRLTFTTNPHGKPLLENSPLHFNLSHTAGMVILAVTLDHPLGIDIESLDRKIEHEDLARRFFTPAESSALLALPSADRHTAFFRMWTRKEALLKATGQGISAGLDTFEVPLTPFTAPVQLGPWTLHDLPVPATHSASLATATNTTNHLHFWSIESFTTTSS